MDVTWSVWWTIGVIAAAVFVAFIALDIWLLMRSRSKTSRHENVRDHSMVPHARTSQEPQQARENEEQARLRARRQRVEGYNVRHLSHDERDRYVERWRLIQGEFVTNPPDAVSRADELVVALMMAEGYPGSSDPERRAEDIEVDHPHAAESYRWAHNALVVSQTSGLRDEDYRNAMMQYGRVFEALAPDESGPVIGSRPPGMSANI